LLSDSSAAARASSSTSEWPSSGTIFSSDSRPSVSVPVLSKAKAFNRAGFSSASPP